MDCVTICAPRVGQEAAWAGLTRAGAWRAARVAEVADRRARFTEAMAARPGGFELLTIGAFFAWVRHPFPDRSTADVVRDLLFTHDTLVLPGTAFQPDDRQTMRVSISNVDDTGIATTVSRFAAMGRTRSSGRQRTGTG
jgi:aspartate/methionine/tyrosine aminotransferase